MLWQAERLGQLARHGADSEASTHP
jgi:hypothetical protein